MKNSYLWKSAPVFMAFLCMKIMNKPVLILFISLFFLSSCGDHFISDKKYREKVSKQFEKTKELAANRKEQLFSVFDKHLSLQEKEALEFLYAYMPLSDLADYDGDFFLKNVRTSFAARDTFSWGRTIPEDIYRHFVLPVRVNNENLDSSRWVFFNEIKDRIIRMPMKEAALEINHWCHEKVTYRGSDGRTSSPLASVKTAYGRCGEESTFAVAALRAACIPARQCYTPRWAHTDDNHAWVEVWVDGKWHFLGACEPDPDLDMGWFSSHVKRAMLVNTTVFGDYTGPEDVLKKEERFTQINVLPNYTKTKKVFVKVTDEKNNPADSAFVEFGLYNYAEFYPLTRAVTDEKGLCSFLTGYGDLLIWGAKNDHFSYKKITVKETDTVHLALTMTPGKEYSVSLDYVPPDEQQTKVSVNDSLNAQNARRLAFEDKIRGNYEKTFIDSTKAYRLAETAKLNPDTLFNILKKSRGNYREITEFITSVPEERKHFLFPLLYAISEKDLRDINTEVLFDQMNSAWNFAKGTGDEEIFVKYILNPRISNEYLKPYQSTFQTGFEEGFINKVISDPKVLVNWIRNNIRIDKKTNYSRAPLTPKGVYELKVADPASRDIFFAAVCRSFGIPARVETASSIPQYYSNGKWIDVVFEEKAADITQRGTIILDKEASEKDIKPEYYIHFTVEHYKDGFYRSLDYETDPSVSVFPSRLDVVPGSYLLLTGNRFAKGSALVNMTFFKVGPEEEKKVMIVMRKKPVENVSAVKVDPAGFLKDATGQNVAPGPEGSIVAWIEPEKEPSRHFIADLTRLKSSFDKWNGSIIFIFQSERERKIFLEKHSREVPAKVLSFVAGTSNMAGKTINKDKPELPVVLLIGKTGEILFESTGYHIGTGDDILTKI